MRRFVNFLVVVLGVTAMLGAFPGLAGAQQAVPFKGSAELTFGMPVVGTGQGTHLGRFTEVAYPVIDTSTVPPTFTATVFLTAANGDVVHKMATGTITSNGTTMTFTGMFTVKGGTGRFSTATGSGQVVMVLSLLDGTIAQTFDGTIRF
jgi:hypothetical protein